MKLVPLGAHVVVRPLEPESTTRGGIVLPEQSKDRSRQGRILSVGDGRLLRDGTRAAMQVREGDRILFDIYGAIELEINGEQLLVMSEDDILAVLG